MRIVTDKVKSKNFEKGAVVTEPGSTEKNKTGGWREFKPVLHKDKCKKCGICWSTCPDNAVRKKEDGSFEIDYDYCKGCLICMNQCPFKAITKEVEKK